MNPTADVIAAAKAAMVATRVPASVTIAQYALESGWGKHMPPDSNNPFGIKQFDLSLPHVMASTTEVINGKLVHEMQPFAAYPAIAAAFAAHADLIATKPIYAAAMLALPDVGQFVTLMAEHYATDPQYAQKLLTLIDEDHLEQYDA